MALIKWHGNEYQDPFSDLWEIQKEMNRLFDTSLIRGFERTLSKGWAPAIDISDEKDRVVVKADLPGVKQENISVDIEDSILAIKGERKEEIEKKDKKVYHSERFYGGFLRSFTHAPVRHSYWRTVRGSALWNPVEKEATAVKSWSFTLPSTVDTAKTKASYKDGVLEIVLPKKEDAKPKSIKVEINK